MNRLLNAFVCLCQYMTVLVPKRMLLFYCVGGFLLDSFAMVPTGSEDFVCDQF